MALESPRMHDPSQHRDEWRGDDEIDPSFVATRDHERDRDDAAHASGEIGDSEPPTNDLRKNATRASHELNLARPQGAFRNGGAGELPPTALRRYWVGAFNQQ